MFSKVLIANRGVAATRIAASLRRMGVPHATVHSEADVDLPHARGTESVCIGKGPARESYLRIEALLDAARRVGADAVHPGYGFLAEDHDFAGAVQAAGMIFIGPAAEHIEAMGDKVNARARIASTGVSLLPASGPLIDGEPVEPHVERIGLPLLVKASAGGGGIGMQRVHDASALAAAVQKARQISARAFGDGTIYLERYLEQPRHVEFQMLGDGHGRVQALFERDCSVQRRHQKVIEESPAPGVAVGVCAAMGEQLAAILGSWKYASLGTVEMLMDRAGAFYFLEMNTRLQVEHGVTEAITGLDLVELQVRIAAGAALSDFGLTTPQARGHAIEVRVYAEDSVRFLPSPGRLAVFQPPAGPEVRVDTGYMEGNTVTPFYDPMLALVIVHGRDRAEAIARMDTALADFSVSGVSTNIPFLRRMLASEDFREIRHHTTLAEEFARRVA